MIEVKGLTKRYGATLAVDNVSFEVKRGEIVGFLGPNGAGKSTTMKVLTGYLAPTAGTALIDGHDIIDDPLRSKAAVGYLPESTPLYEDMGVVDYLRFMGQMQGVAGSKLHSRVDELISLTGLNTMAHKDIGELSKGYRQRAGLAQALLSDPPVLILDEPTSGLDPKQIVEIRALIRNIGHDKAILLSTHILPEAQNVCDRILIINNGRLAGEGTPDELLALASGKERYTLTLKGNAMSQAAAGLGRLRGASGVQTLSLNGVGRFAVDAERGTDLREALFDFAVSGGYKLLELGHATTTLEDVFIQLTGGAGSGMVLQESYREAEAATDEAAAGAAEGGTADE
jgi:ABC-2 type transport system ATP-binding protein